jgi:hypothetical protein
MAHSRGLRPSALFGARANVRRVAALAALAGSLSCDGEADGGSGSLRIQLSAEQTIIDGLSSGPGAEQTRDCAVSYAKFLVAIGGVKLGSSRSGETRADPSVYVADMKQVGEQGPEIARFDELPSGRWDQFEFQTPAAAPGAKALGNVSPADLEEMVGKGLTYWIEGAVQCPERSVSFSFQVAVPTRFHGCAVDGKPGVSVSAGGVSGASITLHGDHPWFDSLPNASEGTVVRRAAWILAADGDRDGRVVTADLMALRAEDAFPSSLGYNLSGANVSSAFDFLRAQLATQGHLNGEGECQWSAL